MPPINPITPPHDDVAEQATLGGLLRDPVNTLDDVRLELHGADAFYHRRHQQLYEVILAQADGHGASSIDLVTVAAMLAGRGWLEDLGGHAGLADVFNSSPASVNAVYYARTVRAMSERRALIHKAEEIRHEAQDPSVEPGELLDFAEKAVLSVRDRSVRSNATPLSEGLYQVLDRLEAVSEDQAIGLSTPWPLLNALVSMRPGELIVAGARTSVGKSILGGQIAMHAADEGHPVFFVSCEMERVDIAARLIAARGDIDATLTGGRRKGTDDESQRVNEVVNELCRLPIMIDDSPGQNVSSIAAQARRMKRKQGLGLIVVDYLQLLEVDRQKNETRATELGEVSRGLKRLAKELQVPILALCQLNREAEKDPEPSLRHLRESGAIEQDADQVWLFWRGDALGAPLIHLKIEKHRGGPTGRVTLRHRQEFMRFDSQY